MNAFFPGLLESTQHRAASYPTMKFFSVLGTSYPNSRFLYAFKIHLELNIEQGHDQAWLVFNNVFKKVLQKAGMVRCSLIILLFL